MIYIVPPISQFSLTEDSHWKSRSCGIASFFMLLKFYIPEIQVTGDELLQKALEKGAYLQNIGWKHAELAKLAEEFGLQGMNYDWYDRSSEDALDFLQRELQKGPVIASVFRDFNTSNEGHLLVVRGIEHNIVYIHEPAEEILEKIPQKIPLDTFLHGWKRRIIVIRNKKNS